MDSNSSVIKLQDGSGDAATAEGDAKEQTNSDNKEQVPGH